MPPDENLNDTELAKAGMIYYAATSAGQTLPHLGTAETTRLNQCKAALGREVLRGYIATGQRSSPHALAAPESAHQSEEDLAARNAEK